MQSPSHALLAGLRRPGNEPQLTLALAAICRADAVFASRFLDLVLTSRGLTLEVPPVEVTAEEAAAENRFDLRFRAKEWDVIVELKVHAGYGPGQLERYLGSLTDVDHAHVVAITRDVPLYGEPPAGIDSRWVGSTRWRALLRGLRNLPVANSDLSAQWQLFLDVLEQEGSMGFTQPDPQLFDAFADARLATLHMGEFLRVVETPILDALRAARGGQAETAALYWPRGGRFSRTRWGRLDIPLRVPADGPWRVRAGIIGWKPPAAFSVQPAPDQRWDMRRFAPEAQTSVDALIAAGFDRRWMRAYLPLDEKLVLSPDFETHVVKWAHARFCEIEASGLFALPLETLGAAVSPDAGEAETP